MDGLHDCHARVRLSGFSLMNVWQLSGYRSCRGRPRSPTLWSVIAKRIISRAASGDGTTPLGKLAFVMLPIAGICGHCLLVVLRAAGVLWIRGAGGRTGSRRSPTLSITGVSLSDLRQFLQIQLTDNLPITSTGSSTAHRGIIWIIGYSDGRHHNSGDCRADKQFGPHVVPPLRSHSISYREIPQLRNSIAMKLTPFTANPAACN